MKTFFNKNLYFLIVAVLSTTFTVYAQEKFPVPAVSNNQLFYLQRTSNTNTLIYELNFSNKVLNNEEPVHVYWIRYNDKGQQEELNYIQRKFAYGLKSRAISKDKYQLNFVSYKKFPMYLVKGSDDKYNVFATINQKQAILSRIFVKINGGSFWTPNIEYVEIKGIDPVTGKELIERMKI
jgi:hypothetical protein